MRISHFFIDRPIFAAVVSIVFVILGGVSFSRLPVAQYPEIAPPIINVSGQYPGASADVVASTVVTPIEQQINGVENMLYMSSNSTADGRFSIQVSFDLGTNLDIAQVQVQNRVAIAQPRLPNDVRNIGVTVTKSSPDLMMVVHLYSPDKSRDALFISNYATLEVTDPLTRVDGVGSITVFGSRDYSMRIWLDPDRLQSLGLTASDVTNALQGQNIQVASGVLDQPPVAKPGAFQIAVQTLGRLNNPEEFGSIVIKQTANAVVRLRDVAKVELAALDYSSNSYLDHDPAVALAVFQRPGSNALDTAKGIIDRMAELSKRFPSGVKYDIVYNPTQFIQQSVNAVIETIGEAIILVVLVVILFLQTWRAAIIPLVAIPVSLIGSFFFLLALGFSLNMVSMLGMVLAIGLVVDDAIVVVENVERQLEKGLPPLEAAKTAMKEVTGPIIATTAVLMAVFVPVAFLPGVTGRLYNQFALTIAISVAISAFNSLSLSPALAAVLLRHREPPRFLPFRLFNTGFTRLANAYANGVRHLIAWRWLVLAGFGAAIAVAYMLYEHLPSGFLPEEDQGYFFAVIQLPDGASLERTEAVAEKVRKILAAEDGVENVIPVTGLNFLTNANQSNSAAEFAVLKPWHERKRTAAQIVAGLRSKLLSLPEAIVLSFDPPSIPGIATTGGFEFEVEDLTGQGAQALYAATQALLAEARKQPELNGQALFSSFGTSTPQYDYDLDRTKAKLEGLSLQDVFNTLQIYLGSLYVNDFNLFGRTFRVTAQARDEDRQNVEDVLKIRVRNANGDTVPLGSFTTVDNISGPYRVPRYDLYPAAELDGAAAPGYSQGQAIAIMDKLAAESLPDGFATEWTTLAFQQIRAGSTAMFAFLLAVVFVFLVLAAQYESLTLPLAVIMIVPMCLVAAITGVVIRGLDNNILTQVGFVVLIGLAAKNAILIVEFARQLEDEGRSRWDAAVEATRRRLRPILMTSFAFILGVTPLVWAIGAGAELRQALGTAVFFGMIGVTAFGLIFTPVFYVVARWIADLGLRWRKRGLAKAHPAE